MHVHTFPHRAAFLPDGSLQMGLLVKEHASAPSSADNAKVSSRCANFYFLFGCLRSHLPPGRSNHPATSSSFLSSCVLCVICMHVHIHTGTCTCMWCMCGGLRVMSRIFLDLSSGLFLAESSSQFYNLRMWRVLPPSLL